MKTISNCKVCGAKLEGKQTLFCSVLCKNKSHQCYDAQKRRGIARKLELIRSRGQSCSICGYKKNLAALTFHHVRDEKKFKLDMRSLSNRTLECVTAEAAKCDLVCHNCHAELHNERLDLAKLLKSSRPL